MDLSKLPLMQAIKSRMKWLDRNEAVISQNIANADTPGYGAKRLKEQDFETLLDHAPDVAESERVKLRITNPKHLAGGGKTSYLKNPEEQASVDVIETTPDGNKVVLEQEMMQLAKNQMDHNLVTSLYRKQVGLVQMALGKK